MKYLKVRIFLSCVLVNIIALEIRRLLDENTRIRSKRQVRPNLSYPFQLGENFRLSGLVVSAAHWKNDIIKENLS